MAVTRLLIGFGESLATPEVVWSLRSVGISCVVFCRRGTRTAVRTLRGIDVIDVTSPEIDPAACVEEIASACHRRGPFAGILPLDDASFMLLHDVALSTPFLGATGGTAEMVIDKRIQFEIAARAGFKVPGYLNVDQRKVSEPSGNWHSDQRVIAKPAKIGFVSEGKLIRPAGRYFENADAAIRFVLDGETGSQPWIVQNIVTGVGQGVFGVATASGLACVSGHQRVRMMNPAGSGSSACESMAPAPDIQEMARAFCELAQLRGMFMIELLGDSAGNQWFMEMNGRAWGSMALARRRGLEYPAWHAQYILQHEQPPAVPRCEETVCRHLGRELVHLLFVLRGNTRKSPSWPSRLETLKAFLTPRSGTKWYNFDRSQRFYMIRDAYCTVRNQFGRKG